VMRSHARVGGLAQAAEVRPHVIAFAPATTSGSDHHCETVGYHARQGQ